MRGTFLLFAALLGGAALLVGCDHFRHRRDAGDTCCSGEAGPCTACGQGTNSKGGKAGEPCKKDGAALPKKDTASKPPAKKSPRAVKSAPPQRKELRLPSVPPDAGRTPPARERRLPPALPPLQPMNESQHEEAPLPGVTSMPPSVVQVARTNTSEWSSPVAAPMPFSAPQLAAPTAPVSRGTSRYSHSADYGVLTGRVQQWRHTWQLRYASVEVIDRHGGSVELVGGAELSRLREGQLVQVRGRLLTAEGRHTQARYQVQTIERIDE